MSSDIEAMIIGLRKHFDPLGIDFFMVGARARDLICEKAKLHLSKRATEDVDFGIFISSWDELELLRKSFANDSDIKLSRDVNNKIRYHYKATPFDLVPFGGIENDDGKVSWKPFYETIMTVVGYKEALTHANLISVGMTNVKVVTTEMLVGLKLVAWYDNQTRQKDAQDIDYILSKYDQIDPGVYEYFLENYVDKIEMELFNSDPFLLGIVVLGIRLRHFTSKEHIILLEQILSSEKLRDRIIRNMIPSYSPDSNREEKECLARLEAFRFGINYSK